MVDIFDRMINNLAQGAKGGLIKRGQLFSGVRDVEDHLQKIHALKDKLTTDIKKGNAKKVLKDLKIDTKDIVEAEQTLIKCILILLADAHDLNVVIHELKATEKQLEQYKLEGIEIYEQKTEEALAELKKGLAKVSAVAGSTARE